MKKRDSGWKPHHLVVFWDSQYEKEAAGGFRVCKPMPNNCLFGKWYSQTNRLWLHSIPAIPWTILVWIPECLDSTGMNDLAGLPAKFYSTGIMGALIRPPTSRDPQIFVILPPQILRSLDLCISTSRDLTIFRYLYLYIGRSSDL